MNDASRRSSRTAQVAAALAAAALVTILVAILGVQFGLFAPLTSFTLFFISAVIGGALCVLLGLSGLFVTRGGEDRVGAWRSLSSLLIGIGLLAVVLVAAAPGAGLPSINDITNNLNHPPHFVAVKKLRGNFGRSFDYPPSFVPQVHAAYGDLHPYQIDLPPAEAFEQALETANEMGWTVVHSDARDRVFEATDETPVFRFVDEISVRVRSEGSGSAIDIRSKSRDGKGDLGTNAARIRAFGARVEAKATGDS